MTSSLQFANNVLLSWIVPLYNCADYIERCLLSMIAQGLPETDYEVVVVDDGSTDGGDAVVRDLSVRHPNIRLISQPNAGVGAARNAGIDAARGEWVHFVDADDCLVPGAMSAILGSVGANFLGLADAVAWQMRKFTTPEDLGRIKVGSIHSRVMPVGDFCREKGFIPNAVCYMLRRSFIIDKAMRFGSLSVGEDLLFLTRLYEHQQAMVAATDAVAYCYYQRPDSVMNRRSNAAALRSFDCYCEIFSSIKHNQALAEYPAEVVDRCVLAYAQCMAMTAVLSASLTLAQVRTLFAKAAGCGMFPIVGAPDRIVAFLAYLSSRPLAAWCMAVPYRWIYEPLIRRRRGY